MLVNHCNGRSLVGHVQEPMAVWRNAAQLALTRSPSAGPERFLADLHKHGLNS